VLDKNNKYTKMQKKSYDNSASQWTIKNRDPVVGVFDSHNKWDGYKYLFIDIPDLQNKVVLDFACGPGRNLVKYKNTFKKIDGVDISEINLKNAELWIKENKYDVKDFNLYLCNGVDLENIKDNSYDIVMSTIALQHICVYDIRFNYLKEFFRILKPGGHIAIQMGFGSPSKNTVGYYENYYEAKGTNRVCDTEIKCVEQVEQDLTKIGFTNFKYNLTGPGPGDCHPQWIYFSGEK
jgi:ubiquinone/menaquinone biosynthesis C-methylase UbiE